MSREMGMERLGGDFFFPRGFHFKDSEGASLALSRLLQHTREWMKQLSHLNTHSGNPLLSTMPGQNRKSINTYKAFYLFSNSSPFTKSSICGVETGATCHWWLFAVQQLLGEGVWEVVRWTRWVFEDVKNHRTGILGWPKVCGRVNSQALYIKRQKACEKCPKRRFLQSPSLSQGLHLKTEISSFSLFMGPLGRCLLITGGLRESKPALGACKASCLTTWYIQRILWREPLKCLHVNSISKNLLNNFGTLDSEDGVQ